MILKTKLQVSIPLKCPKCGSNLRHTNALSSKAKVYMVCCTNTKCRFCRDYKPCPNCGALLCQ